MLYLCRFSDEYALLNYNQKNQILSLSSTRNSGLFLMIILNNSFFRDSNVLMILSGLFILKIVDVLFMCCVKDLQVPRFPCHFS